MDRMLHDLLPWLIVAVIFLAAGCAGLRILISTSLNGGEHMDEDAELWERHKHFDG